MNSMYPVTALSPGEGRTSGPPATPCTMVGAMHCQCYGCHWQGDCRRSKENLVATGMPLQRNRGLGENRGVTF